MGQNFARAPPAVSAVIVPEIRYINVFSEINLVKHRAIDLGRGIL